MDQTEFKAPVTNWGNLPLVLQQGDVVAHIEEAAIGTEDDDVWQSVSVSTVRTLKSENLKNCQQELCLQLIFGTSCTEEECQSLRQLLCDKHEVFVLTDHEMGEVDLRLT